jgi:cytochrome bd-type quinol oxidase subunit 2
MQLSKFVQNKNKKYIVILIVIIIFLGSSIGIYAADNLQSFGTNLGKVGKIAGFNIEQTSPDSLIVTIINIALSFLGVIFLVLMIYGGYLWMTARGNEQQAQKARDLIIAAVIGVVIVVAAYAITWFIMSKVTLRTLEGGGGQTGNDWTDGAGSAAGSLGL